MLLEYKQRNREDDAYETINMEKVVRLRIGSDIENPEITLVTLVFEAVPNKAMNYLAPSISVGKYYEHNNAYELYSALQRMDWSEPGFIHFPSEDENISEIIKNWKKRGLIHD